MPESSGLDILADAVDAVKWVHQNITTRIIIAGSSAGGYLALASAAHPECPRPIAVLSIYGLLDPANKRYLEEGIPLRAPVPDLQAALQEVDAATKDSKAIDGYSFPSSPPTDQRFSWIGALHESARYPDQLTRIPGLAKKIASHGVSVIPESHRVLFPVSFGLMATSPPTVLLHGSDDILVRCDQSVSVADKMNSLGTECHLEVTEGQGHGFDTKEINVETVDTESDKKAIRSSLRRVIVILDEIVSKDSA